MQRLVAIGSEIAAHALEVGREIEKRFGARTAVSGKSVGPSQSFELPRLTGAVLANQKCHRGTEWRKTPNA